MKKMLLPTSRRLLSGYLQSATESGALTRIVDVPQRGLVIYQEQEFKGFGRVVGILFKGIEDKKLHPVSIPPSIISDSSKVSKHLSSENYIGWTISDQHLREAAAVFDPVVFKKFLESLNPVVVENLGLNRGKADNIDLYNLCVSSELSERATRNRSKILGLFPVFRGIIEYGRKDLLSNFD